jgi:pyrroline-5-carboxylate reductase
MPSRIAFVGAGQMAQALARGFIASGLATADRITAYDPSSDAGERFLALAPGVALAPSNAEAAREADVVILAVKPQSLKQALAELRPAASADRLFISIVAGATLADLSAGLGTDRIVRVMPNTPCLLGQGASAFAAGPGALPADGELVRSLLSSVGKVFPVDEKLLDAVTGLSGSGPAYVFVMIEALADGGVKMGLPRDAAMALAAQTVLGAAALCLAGGEHPAQLKDRVASPGGTTIAGLAALESHGFRGAVIAAVEAATKRSQELGRKEGRSEK